MRNLSALLAAASALAFASAAYAQQQTTTTLSSDAQNDQVVYGGQFTIEATVTAAGGTTVNQGQVYFFGPAFIPTDPLNVTNGVAGGTVSAYVNPGVIDIKAEYVGHPNYDSSESPDLSIDVVKASTSTTISALPNPVPSTGQVTFTASVSGIDTPAVPNGGTITFVDDGQVLTAFPKPIIVSGDSGVASVTVSAAELLRLGPDVVAYYTGDVDFTASRSSPASVQINPPPVSGGVPEPATWAMLVLGMGLTGAALRRRSEGTALTA